MEKTLTMLPSTTAQASCLSLTSSSDGGGVLVLDAAIVAASGLNGLDNALGLLVNDLAKDDVLAVEPGRHDSGDEELGAVAA